MFSAAFKMMRISYRLFWIALITMTGGVWGLAFHLVSLRLVRWMWRAWRRPKQEGLSEAGRNAEAGDLGKRVNAARRS
jgi:hypothetical protein